MRPSGRAPAELRRVIFERRVSKHAEGSCLVRFGDTHVLCTATVEGRLPPWLKGQNRGWVTAEYGMLPRSTGDRMRREATSGRQSGRTQEIQRLIGRSLRAVVDLPALGENQITIDCDVLQADGGTRTAAITGAYVALVECLAKLKGQKLLREWPLLDQLAAVSVGIVGGQVCIDLNYDEDSTAAVDMNVVVTGDGRLVEVQGTAEGDPFSRRQMDALIDAAQAGARELFARQREVLREVIELPEPKSP